MRHGYLLVALTAAAMFSLLSGCGGGDEETTTPATMAPAKYAQKTDVICGDASIEQGELAGAYLEKHPETKEVDLVIPAAVPPIEKEIEEIRELGLPKGQEKEAEVFLEEAEKALQELKEEPSSALSQKDNSFEKANELGEKLGLGDCSRNP